MLNVVSAFPTQLKLAKEAQEAARTAVEMDAHNDLAHHLMGRWHFEMAQINFVLRQVRQQQLESTHAAPCIAPCTYALLTQLMQHDIFWWQNCVAKCVGLEMVVSDGCSQRQPSAHGTARMAMVCKLSPWEGALTGSWQLGVVASTSCNQLGVLASRRWKCCSITACRVLC